MKKVCLLFCLIFCSIMLITSNCYAKNYTIKLDNNVQNCVNDVDNIDSTKNIIESLQVEDIGTRRYGFNPEIINNNQSNNGYEEIHHYNTHDAGETRDQIYYNR